MTTGALCYYNNDKNNLCKTPVPSDGGDITQRYCNKSRDLESLDGYASASGFTFKSDGTKAIIYGWNVSPYEASLYEYSLSTPWDISTMTLDYRLGVTASSPSGHLSGAFVSADGVYAYSISNGGTGSGEFIYRYTMATPWSLSSATLTDTWEISPGDDFHPEIYGLHFSPSGDNLWIVDNSVDSITTYSMSEAWKPSTSTLGSMLDISSYGTVFGVYMNESGDRVYMNDLTANTVNELQMTAPFDITTATSLTSTTVTDITTYNNIDTQLSPDGKYMYILTYNDGFIYQVCLTND